MRRLNNFSLQTKLIVAALAISIIPVTIISFLANVAIHTALVNAANDSLAGAAAQTAANLDGFVQANLDAVRTEAQLPDFGDLLGLHAQSPAGGAEFEAAAARLAVVLHALSRRDQLFILSYALLDQNGVDVIDTDSADAGLDQSQRDFFVRPMSTGLPYASPVEFSNTDDLPSIFFSAPVRNAQGKILGVLLVNYNATSLQQIVARASGLAGNASFGVLLDDNHMRLADGAEPDLIFTTVAPLNPDKVVELQAAGRLPRRPADQLSTNLAAFDQGLINSAAQPFFHAELHALGPGGEAVAVARLTTEPWLVAFGQTESVFLAPVDQETRNLTLIGIIMIAFIALAVAGGTRLLTGPINRLTVVAAQVGAGDLTAQVRWEANDEIGKLAQTFNAMTARLRQTLAGLTERSAELRLANEQLQSDLVERQRGEASLRESEAKYRTLVDEINDGFYTSDLRGNLTFANRALARVLGVESPQALIGRNFVEFLPPEKVADLAEQYRAVMSAGAKTNAIETEVVRPDGTRAAIEIKPQIIFEAGRPVGNRGTLRDISERRRAEEEIQRRLEELEAINRVSTRMRSAQTLDELLPLVLDVTLDVVHALQGSIWLYDSSRDELRAAVARGWGEVADIARLPPEKPGLGLAGSVFRTGQSHIADDFHTEPSLPEVIRQQIPPGMGGAVIPIRAANVVIGTLIVNVLFPRKLSANEVQLLAMVCEIAGNAIQRTQLHEQTEQRLRRLGALHEIDVAINASLELQATLDVFVDEVMAQLRVDAAAVILLNPDTQMLQFAVGRGFRTPVTQWTGQRPGEGNTGRAALERRTIHIPDLRRVPKEAQRTTLLTNEGFVTYYGVPLIAKGQVRGVLEVFQRAQLEPGQEWLNFLEALAGQAAIAVDNSSLFKDLQRSNVDLRLAYDATIEGWSRALDLRDKETEGHTQRVTEITLGLAHRLGFTEEALVHLRRGALLHDIGKMGIPDTILLKPGKLTDDEWVIMRKHPQYAYALLYPIVYLRPALDIPYCHHEKWDGTGYPQGLIGEQIPLAARLFAVVDVWDALTNDRPYRQAWPAEKVRDYIRSLAGTHFDPQMVKAVLDSGLLNSPAQVRPAPEAMPIFPLS